MCILQVGFKMLQVNEALGDHSLSDAMNSFHVFVSRDSIFVGFRANFAHCRLVDLMSSGKMAFANSKIAEFSVAFQA